MLITFRNLFLIFLFILSGLVSFPCYSQDNDQVQLAIEYYNKGELEKSKDILRDLSKSKRNIPLIHDTYFDILLKTKDYSQAEKYISKVIKQFPDNILYKIDQGRLLNIIDEKEDAAKIFNRIIDNVKKDQYKLRLAAQAFFNNELPGFAIKAYREGRKVSDAPLAYAIELANIYRRLNKKDEMIQEYLNFINQNPSNITYVKNVLQNLLTEEDDLVSLENVLYDKIQDSPDQQMYSDLLIWVNLQQKNFYGAFLQARAFDKRLKTGGTTVMDIGIIALENKDYTNAVKAFNYIIKQYPSGLYYQIARRYLIKSREELVKNTFPVDIKEIKELIEDYEKLIADVGISSTTLEAMRSKALLHAFYLNEKDSAISLLQTIIDADKVDPGLKAKSKLDLGDIYLLKGEPWESTLLYSQVEKSQKEQSLGYEAKLRNAKLSYFKGDFELAQGHLDVLKLATTREIANDAISLSLLIKDNTVLDTSDMAMKEYAAIELMLFQNQVQDALNALKGLLEKYPGHSLTDEIYWLQAKIFMQIGEFAKAITLLEKIEEQYNYDILSDDAYFTMGSIYERQLQDKDKAMEVYQSFLTKYPGSIYSAEARKRFRELRGDFVN